MKVLLFAPLGHSPALMQTPTGIAGKMAVGQFEWKTGTEGLRFACWVVVALSDWILREMQWRETLPGEGWDL